MVVIIAGLWVLLVLTVSSSQVRGHEGPQLLNTVPEISEHRITVNTAHRYNIKDLSFTKYITCLVGYLHDFFSHLYVGAFSIGIQAGFKPHLLSSNPVS